MHRPMILQRAGVRLVLSLAAGAGVFYAADYLATNTAAAIAEREARANAAVVSVAREIYAANGWPGMGDPDAADADETVATAAPPAAADRVRVAAAAGVTGHDECLLGTCLDPPGANEPFAPIK